MITTWKIYDAEQYFPFFKSNGLATDTALVVKMPVEIPGYYFGEFFFLRNYILLKLFSWNYGDSSD